MTLGQKIKHLRLSLGITQSELCGDTITRNMLSRIENGAALPSLPTLQYLAGRLGVSAGYFLDEGDDPLPFRKLASMAEIRAEYEKGAYGACLALCREMAEDEEIKAISALCLLELGKACYQKELFRSAETFLKEAQSTARACLYPLTCTTREAEALLAAISRAGEDKATTLAEILNGSDAEAVEHTLYVYMLNVTQNARYDLAAAIYDTLKFQNTLYKKHINARLSLSAHNLGRAVSLLGELVDSFDTQPSDPLFRLQVLKDMENAAHLAGNYEKAYKCLVQKNAIMSGFEK